MYCLLVVLCCLDLVFMLVLVGFLFCLFTLVSLIACALTFRLVLLCLVLNLRCAVGFGGLLLVLWVVFDCCCFACWFVFVFADLGLCWFSYGAVWLDS